MFLHNGFVFQSGDRISCYISDSFIQGTIHINAVGRMWICHDNPQYDGDSSDVLHGHRFSWTFHQISYSRLSDDITLLEPLIQYVKKKDVTIDAKLNKIFSTIFDKGAITRAFHFKLKPFEDFCSIEYSDNSGFIVLNGSVKTKNGVFKKKIEIKLSRYLKKITDSYSALLKEQNLEPIILFNDSQIEKIYNSFVAFQSGEYFQLEILRGDDVAKGYKKDNYSNITAGTIHNSCMSDRTKFLNLYKQNDNVSLAVLKSPNGIEARCLLWTLEDGKTYYDRIYFSFEWIFNVMKDKLKKMSYLSLTDESTGEKINAKVKIQNGDFEFYPYVDSFSIYSPETKYLYCCDMTKLPAGEYRRYQRTDGSFINFSVPL